jgi:hypothetical protein
MEEIITGKYRLNKLLDSPFYRNIPYLRLGILTPRLLTPKIISLQVIQ